MPYFDLETTPATACRTCGSTLMRDFDGRPFAPLAGFGPGYRVFSWHCANGHYNYVPSDEIATIRESASSEPFPAPVPRQVVTVHRMD